MSKARHIEIKTKHSHFHWVHLVAVFILGGYFVLSKVNLLNALARESLFERFLQIYLFGIIFACIFLFLFSHEKFFPFAREMEKTQSKKEKKYLKKYIHHGKVLGTFIIGTIGGPVFSSLTARLLLNTYHFKYLLVILCNIPSTILTVGIGSGFVHVFDF